MKHKRRYLRHDLVTKRYLQEQEFKQTLAELTELYNLGIISFCPGGKVKLTPAARREYKWWLL